MSQRITGSLNALACAIFASLFILLSLASPPASADEASATTTTVHRVRERLDLRYHPGWGRHTLDVFSPSKGTDYPVVVFVHGGTWMYGDKNFFGMYRGVGRFLARNGIVAVLVNYRLSPLVKHPEHTKDIARAYAWVHKNIAYHGGDPDRLILAGHSAGGHLASLLATDDSYLKDPALKLDDNARKALKGVVSVCGVYRIPSPEEFKGMASRIVASLVGEPDESKKAKVLGTPLVWAGKHANPFPLVFGSNADVQKKASPINHIRPGLPPFLLLNAEREVPGLWTMAEDFTEALKKNGTPVAMEEIEGSTHRTIVYRLHSEQEKAGKAMLEFVRKHTASSSDKRKAAVAKDRP